MAIHIPSACRPFQSHLTVHYHDHWRMKLPRGVVRKSNVRFEIDDVGSETDLGDHSDDAGPRKTSCSSVEFEMNTSVQLGGEFPQHDPRNNDEEIQRVPQSASVAMAPGGVQTGEKLFPCTECSKTYNKRYNLQLHMRSHTGERLYVCGECDKRFTEQSKLNAHMRIHSGDKRYICAECDKRFTKKFSLDCHKKTHDKNRPLSSGSEKPYSCDYCEKKFAHKSSLGKHSNIHTNGKVYSCYECDRTFSRNDALRVHIKRHMKAHEKEKPFPCFECGKSFSWQKGLKSHLKYAHGHEKSSTKKKDTDLFELYGCGISCQSLPTNDETIRCFHAHWPDQFSSSFNLFCLVANHVTSCLWWQQWWWWWLLFGKL